MLMVLMFLGASLFGAGLFLDRILEKEAMKEAFQTLDMVEIVKNEIGERYEIIGELLDTEEFKDIISTYSDGFIDYILEGDDKMKVSKEQIRKLFTNYSEILLAEYPELSILPTSKFVNFLVESIDIEKMLPSYEKMLKYVPENALKVMKLVHSPLFFACSLALFLFSLVGYLALDKYHALLYGGEVILVLAMLFMAIVLYREQIFNHLDLKEYALIKPAMIYLCTYLKPIAKMYLFVGGGISACGLWMKGRKV